MEQPSSSAQGIGSLELPQELIDEIIEYLWDDHKALRQSCLASRSFRPLCQKYIFEHVRLNPVSLRRLAENISENDKALKPDASGSCGPTITMAQRLHHVLQSSPHLAQLIKDLRICNLDESDWNSYGWLEDDISLPHILPLLVNLERFYLSGSLTDDSRIEMRSLPKPVNDAFFSTWKSSKLTHIGIHCVVFPSFEDLSSVLLNCTAVQDITLCFVDVEDDEDGFPSSPRATDTVCNESEDQPPNSMLPAAVRTASLDTLALFAEPEMLSQICAWLMSPKSNLPLSSLRKLHLPVGPPDDLPFFHQILEASPSLEELHITLLTWVESAVREPADISSLRVVHMAIDLGEDDDGFLPSHHPTLRWWCDSLTSSRSINLTDLDIYLLTDVDELEEADWELQPEWKRLDEILSSRERPPNFRIRIMEDEPDLERTLDLKPLKPLELAFSKMNDKGKLNVGYMQAKEIFYHFGVNWVQEP